MINTLWCLGHYLPQYEYTKINVAVNYVEQINRIGDAYAGDDNANPEYQEALALYICPSDELYDNKLIRSSLWPDELTAEQRQWLSQ